jgi:hypothetical protein
VPLSRPTSCTGSSYSESTRRRATRARNEAIAGQDLTGPQCEYSRGLAFLKAAGLRTVRARRALIQLTRALDVEFRPMGIRVNRNCTPADQHREKPEGATRRDDRSRGRSGGSCRHHAFLVGSSAARVAMSDSRVRQRSRGRRPRPPQKPLPGVGPTAVAEVSTAPLRRVSRPWQTQFPWRSLHPRSQRPGRSAAASEKTPSTRDVAIP